MAKTASQRVVHAFAQGQCAGRCSTRRRCCWVIDSPVRCYSVCARHASLHPQRGGFTALDDVLTVVAV